MSGATPARLKVLDCTTTSAWMEEYDDEVRPMILLEEEALSASPVVASYSRLLLGFWSARTRVLHD